MRKYVSALLLLSLAALAVSAQSFTDSMLSIKIGYSIGSGYNSPYYSDTGDAGTSLTFMGVDYDSSSGYIYCDDSGYVIMNDDTLLKNIEFVKLLHYVIMKDINSSYEDCDRRIEYYTKHYTDWYKDRLYDLRQECICMLQQQYEETKTFLKQFQR